MNKEDIKQAILGFTEFFKGITGNQDLKIPDNIAKEYEIEQTRCKDTEGTGMTREEAANIITKYILDIWMADGKSVKDVPNFKIALDMAIKVLKQEPCADMVSRDAMWEVLQRLYGTEGELVEELMSLPPVLPMPKIGKWIYDKKKDSYKCSLCGFPCHKDNLGAIPTMYCAGCGAVMEAEG